MCETDYRKVRIEIIYCPNWYYLFYVYTAMFRCRACGDPHYRTFDGKRYDYMGNCNYILAQSRPEAPGSFVIVGDNKPWARNPRATVTRYVYVFVYGLVS